MGAVHALYHLSSELSALSGSRTLPAANLWLTWLSRVPLRLESQLKRLGHGCGCVCHALHVPYRMLQVQPRRQRSLPCKQNSVKPLCQRATGCQGYLLPAWLENQGRARSSALRATTFCTRRRTASGAS